MYGPTKGDMQFLIGLAFVGIASIVITVVVGLVWLFLHLQPAIQ